MVHIFSLLRNIFSSSKLEYCTVLFLKFIKNNKINTGDFGKKNWTGHLKIFRSNKNNVH